MNKKTHLQLYSQKGRVNDEKRVGVLKDQNGDIFLLSPKGYLLTFQSDNWRLYKVVPVKI